MSVAAPLAGKRVLVTRAEGQANEIVTLLEAAGASAVHVPAIRFVAPPSWDSLDEALDDIASCHWMIFTSSNGVEFFFRRLTEKGINPSSLSAVQIAAVGAATASELRTHGIEPVVVPRSFRGSEIVPLLPDEQEGVRTVVVRALEGREELIETLRARGGSVHVAIAYETRTLERMPDNLRIELLNGSFDALTFTSPSTVRGLLTHLANEELAAVRRHSTFFSIGPTTTAALRDFGVAHVHEAKESTARGLVDALVRAT